MPLILAGDIGGTKSRLALVDAEAGFKIAAVAEYPSRSFTSFGAAIAAFRQEHPHEPGKVGIGAAGPVLNRRIDVTNLPWVIDAKDLTALGYKDPVLANDMAAYGAGIELLTPDGIETLNLGEPRLGNRALIAAGTGLGESFLVPRQPEGWTVYGSEGGHTDFSPTSDIEIDLLQFMRTRFRRVSWERVLSGLFGFDAIVRFLASTGRFGNEDALISSLGDAKDTGPLITAAAAQGNPLANATVRLFARLYGSEAGNLVLKYFAINGVYLGGGIALRILPWLREGAFLEAFTAKGRFSGLLEKTPVHVITDKDCAIKGAALLAKRPI